MRNFRLKESPIGTLEQVRAEIDIYFKGEEYRITSLTAHNSSIDLSLVYYDFKPEQEVVRHLVERFPNIQCEASRDYSYTALSSLGVDIAEHISGDKIWMYDVDQNPVCIDTFQFMVAYFANKEIRNGLICRKKQKDDEENQ